MPKLPDNIPAIATARLPAAYEAAKAEIMNCMRVDEAKERLNRMEALATYAELAHNDELLREARRLQVWAYQRAGELLAEQNAQGQRNDKLLDGAVPKLGIAQAAEAAGFTERQRKYAIRIAAMDKDELEAWVESTTPPTVAALAEAGARPHRIMGTGNEWNTPKLHIEAARRVLGDFDLDPASNELSSEDGAGGAVFYKRGRRARQGMARPGVAQSAL